MSGPSTNAIQAAYLAIEARKPADVRAHHAEELHSDADVALCAAHSRSLGVDRSVCLRDVLEFLRGTGDEHGPSAALAVATILEGWFGT